jgi:hypothetical protein
VDSLAQLFRHKERRCEVHGEMVCQSFDMVVDSMGNRDQDEEMMEWVFGALHSTKTILGAKEVASDGSPFKICHFA